MVHQDTTTKEFISFMQANELLDTYNDLLDALICTATSEEFCAYSPARRANVLNALRGLVEVFREK